MKKSQFLRKTKLFLRALILHNDFSKVMELLVYLLLTFSFLFYQVPLFQLLSKFDGKSEKVCRHFIFSVMCLQTCIKMNLNCFKLTIRNF